MVRLSSVIELTEKFQVDYVRLPNQWNNYPTDWVRLSSIDFWFGFVRLTRPGAVSQKPEKESLTPPPPLNPVFLTPPPTVETPSQQGPKRKRRRSQFLNYLDDHNAHGKQLRKRSRHKKFEVNPYKYFMGEEEDEIFSIPYKSLCI